jgi:CRISPR/Cas system-associated exonuclease Cas4 (RecB family)
MNGRLVLGPVTRELFDAFRQEIARWVEADPLAPGVVLVGSNLLGLQLRRRLALDGTAHAGLRFLTFVDLGRGLAAPRVAGRAPLPPGGRALVARAHGASPPPAGYFSPVASRPGFHRALATTFGDLDDGGFAADVAALVADTPPDEAKLREVVGFYAAYRARVEPQFVTSSDLIRLAAAEAHRFREAFGTARLALFGFYDFTEVQRRLLGALARTDGALERFTAFAPEPDLAGHAFAREGVEFLAGLGLDVERLAPETAAPPAPSTPRIEVISAPSEVEEAREIARSIFALARDGVPFREVAVLLRLPATYAPLLREALTEADIPFYLHQGMALGESAAGKAFRLLLALAGTTYARADVVEFLTAAPLAPGRAPAAALSPSLWDLVTRRAGIVEGRDAWRERLDRFARREPTAARGAADPEARARLARERRAAASLAALVECLFEDLDALPASGSWAEHGVAARRLLEGWIAPSEERTAIADLTESLAPYDRLAGPATFAEFRETLVERMDATVETIGRFGIDAVTVSDLSRARGLSFRVVFVPGVVERGFPVPPSQDPILLDRDRRRLTATRRGALPPRLARAREEELYFALAGAAAEETIVLSYPRFEAGTDRERTPSPFLVRALEEKHGRRVEIRDLGRLDFGGIGGARRIPMLGGALAEPDRALALVERRVGIGLGSTTPDAARSAVAERLASEHPAFARAVAQWDARWGDGRLNPHSGRLSQRAVGRVRDALRARGLSHLLTEEVLSPSSMETYATCPHRYFFKEVLRIEEVPEPEKTEEIETTDRGILVHRVLEEFFTEMAREGRLPIDADAAATAEARLLAIAEIAFRGAEERGLTGFPLLWRLQQAKIRAALAAFVRAEASGAFGARSPRPMLEASFGEGEGAGGEARITLPGGRALRFRGKIDRLDATADGRRFVVIDYKARWKAASTPKDVDPVFRLGETLQLPIYLLAAPTCLGAGAPAGGDALYVELVLSTSAAKASEPLSTETLAERRGALVEILDTIVDGVQSGLFPVFPNEGKNCAVCDYQAVCGPPRLVTALFRAKSSRPEGERFVRFLRMKGCAP